MEDTSGVFERFTDRARRVVVLAQEEARMLDHNYIGTEHLLLGLVHEGEGVAAQVLESLNVSLEVVRIQVEEIIGQGKVTPSGHIPFTPRAKKVLELSLREALQLHHNYIGTEHILLGLIREGEGVAALVLQKLGADLNRVREAVIGQLSQGGDPSAHRVRFEGAERRSAQIAEDVARRDERLKRIGELAAEEAAALGAKAADPEHLWLGSLRYDIDQVEKQLLDLYSQLEADRAKARERRPPA
jgi:ATP-dependent Clp protease ATP-binding subunit ClpC